MELVWSLTEYFAYDQYFKWVSNPFVFKECFHKTEFWMTLFPPVDSLAHC